MQPRWSPHGQRIAFWGLRGGTAASATSGRSPPTAPRRAGRGRGHERRGARLEPGLVARRPLPLLLERPRRHDEPVARGDRRGDRPHARRAGAGHDAVALERLDSASRATASRSLFESSRLALHAPARRPRSRQRAASPDPPHAGAPRLARRSTRRTSRRTGSGSPSRHSAAREDLFVVRSDGTRLPPAHRRRLPRPRPELVARTARGSPSTATGAAATRPGRSGPTAAASSSSRRRLGPPARKSPGRPTERGSPRTTA